ncbi:MAG: hypothetical protein VX733_13590 [Candidatus Latescibacterota bacterium]|nr:hypothetical protein [Candidatus Latescibacterota bacterium]
MRRDLGNGFVDHGVATPISNHRGTVATVDGEGRNVVLLWLFDHRGGYALLRIDVATGDAMEIPMPFDPGGDCPFASILSTRNRYYTHFNGHFCEYDPAVGEFTFCHETVQQMAMGMTEDDEGRIWSVTYPDSGVACYDPGKRLFRDYGHVYVQNWRQYQRHVACDDRGWLYFAVGSTASQIVTLEPESGTANPLLAEAERCQGTAFVERDEDGRVYGQALAGQDEWFEFYTGERVGTTERRQRRAKQIITDSQSLFWRDFPDGWQLVECDLVERRLTTKDDTGAQYTVKFDYSSEGAHLMGLATAPDDTLCGGTAFPMRFFSYDPACDEWINRASYGQWNTVRRGGDRFFVAGYTGGFLLEWDPAEPWVETEPEDESGNPHWWAQCAPAINRPHCMIVTEDGQWVVFGGTPGYGHTGGGLYIWNRRGHSGMLLEHEALVAQQSPHSLLDIGGGQVLVGTTVQAGTGGERKADVAEFLIVDLMSRSVEKLGPLVSTAEQIDDMVYVAGDRDGTQSGTIVGIADRRQLFALDLVSNRVTQNTHFSDDLGDTVAHQGPRVFVTGGGEIWVLLTKGLGKLITSVSGAYAVEMVAESPQHLRAGGDYLNGRLYFACGSHLCSWRCP